MSTGGPLVSVIMPTYKRSALLRRSIISVLSQTYRDLELIVVDDCSPDNTTEVVAEFSDPRLRYLRREQNGRAAAARNDGLRLARGSLIAFQDDDDIWLPHKLERQVAEMQRQPPEVGLLVCSYIRAMRWGGVDYVGGKKFFDRLNFGDGNPGGIDYGLIATPGWLLRREYAERAGEFDVRLRSWDDWELGLRLWRICRFAHLDEPLFIQDHLLGSAMMYNDPGRVADLRVIREKHADLWADRPDVRATHHFFIGRRECLYGDMAAGRAELLASLRLRPLHFRTLIAYVLSWLGPRWIEFAMGLLHVLRYPSKLRDLLRRPPKPPAAPSIPQAK
jgi:glycosyltransferase involved in cell wall biosynthesis